MFCSVLFLSRSLPKNILFSFIESVFNLPELSISNGEIISSLKISDENEDEEEIEPFSTSELDEILSSFPMNFLTREDDSIIDLDLSNNSVDNPTMTSDDLFVQMLLDNDNFTINERTTFDDLFFPNLSSSLPRITSVDEFDAFLRDFTRNFSSHPQEIATTIS